MGRIRPTIVKKIASVLVEEHPDRFNDDFEHNKNTLKELGLIKTKKMRNKVAGYIVRTVKKKKF